MIKRRSPAFLGFLTVGILIIVGASLWSILVRGSTPAPAANAVAVAPILSEEVVFSKLPPGPTVRSDPALTLLEDSGAAIAGTHLKAVPRNAENQVGAASADPYTKLRSTKSSFKGVGLEGSAKVNGKPFSWANVNLSNISYG